MVDNWKENFNNFKCRVCNFPLVIYEIQAKREKTIFKAKCPAHGFGVIKIPTGEVSKLIPDISDRIFRCFTCGGVASVDQMTDKDVWKLLKVRCPIHGVSKKYKINYHIFSEVWSHRQKGFIKTIPIVEEAPKKNIPKEKHVEIEETSDKEKPPEAISEVKREDILYCRACGVKLKEDYVFCNKCGVKILKKPLDKKKEKEQNYCGECGYPLDHGYKFCIRCGARL
ncbi:MAG: double zinc ribbon domain-containing protein [Candidatus Helarchaeota archaeon]